MANISSSNGLENRPKLRFPGFDEPWQSAVLSSVFEKNTKKNADGQVTNVICNSAKQGLIPQREYFDKDIANSDNTNGYYIIADNDFVYNPRKSSDAPYGPISRYKYSEDGIVSPLYLCFRAKKEINPAFFEWYFRSSAWHRYIYMSGDSGARHDRVSIKDDIFFSMPINIPATQEQAHIASFLEKIDLKIAKQRALVDALKKYKRGLLRAIFNQKFHITDDNEEWKECRIGDILKILHGKDYKEYQDVNGEYPVLGTGGVIDHSTKYICDWPCVLIGRKGTIDKPQYMDKPFWTVDTLFYSKPEFSHNPKFQYYLFQTVNWKKYNEASGVPSQSSSTIEGINICIPNLKTQEVIARLFSNIDELIKNQNFILSHLQDSKNGLLQQLFI